MIQTNLIHMQKSGYDLSSKLGSSLGYRRPISNTLIINLVLVSMQLPTAEELTDESDIKQE